MAKRSQLSLKREDWIEGGRVVLEHRGVDGVKIEALARELGVSKGSFYWHFRDRKDLLWSMLDYWERSTDALIEAADRSASGEAQLQMLFVSIGEAGLTGEAGILAWAQREPEVAKRVAIVEQKRVAYLQELFRGAGFSEAEAKRRGEICYLAFLGFVDRLKRDEAISLDRLGDDLVSLLFSSKEEAG